MTGYLQLLVHRTRRYTEQTMPDQTPLVRQWTMLKILCVRRYGVTVRELAEEMAVSQKTIRRDLETFQTVGFPLEEAVCDHGQKKWHLRDGHSQPGLSFTFDEAIALYLGRRLLEPFAGTLFWEAAQRAFRKIRASLGPEALKYVERFGEMFHQTLVGVSDYSKKAEIIDQLMIGIEDRKAVFVTYQSLQATEPVTYDVYPYGITYHRGSLYLIGRAPRHEEIRHWKIDRMEDAEVTPVHFNRPDDFDLEEHLAHSFGVFQGQDQVHVRVRFDRRVARYVQESNWHASQQLTPQKDGSLMAEFDLSNGEEIKRWVMSFGKRAEVLEPESLRQEILEELTSLCTRYTDQDREATF